MKTADLLKWRHYRSEIILLNVRWYCRYPLSYRDLEEMMLERGLEVDHSIINRWVLQYSPELIKRCRRHLKPTKLNRSQIYVLVLPEASKSQISTVSFGPIEDKETASFKSGIASNKLNNPESILYFLTQHLKISYFYLGNSIRG